MTIKPIAFDSATGALKTGATALSAYPGTTGVASETHAATGKTTPVDADEVPIADSAASFALKKLTWANLKVTIKNYYDSVTSTVTNKNLTSGTNTFPTFNQNTTGSAAKLTTARNINGVAFDGTANITVADPTKMTIGSLFINVKDAAYGAVGDGVADDTAAILAAFAAIPAGGACVFFPAGIYLCSTVAAGVILNLANKADVTLMGFGQQSILRFSASCTDALRIDTCTRFKMRDMRVEIVAGTVTRAVHYTTASPGSAHTGRFQDVFIDNPTSVSRNAFDVMTTSGSAVIYSAAAVFAGGDVGGRVMIDYQAAPHITTISSVATLSGTLAAGINSSVTTVTLNSVLSGSPPASGFTIQVGTERMWVTAGGNTTTLTVVRARGRDFVATSHSTSDAVTTYKATLAATVPFTTSEPAGMIRIESTAAHMDYGLGIGMDHPGASDLDIAQTMLTGVTVTNAVAAGVAIGNGTTGNILDQWAYGLSIAKCGYGVLMNGGSISIDGGDFGYALIDIKRLQPVSQEVKIDGIRTEELGMHYSYTGGTTSGPGTRLSSIEAFAIYAEDGVQIRHLSAASLLLQNVRLTASDVVNGNVNIVAAGNTTNLCHVVAINVGTTTGLASALVDTTANKLTVINESIIVASTSQILPSTVPNLIEGGLSVTQAITNTRVTPRINTVASSATPAINVDTTDQFNITALAAAITSMTTNLTGTATDGQPLRIRIKGDATPRAITWGASFQSSGTATLLATTAASKTHMVDLRYDAATAKWICTGVDATGY